MESICCPETSVRNDCYALRKRQKSADEECSNPANKLSFLKVEELCRKDGNRIGSCACSSAVLKCFQISFVLFGT